MLLLQTSGEFYIDKTTPLTTTNRDFEGLFVNGTRIFKCRCPKALLRLGIHEVMLHRVGDYYEVVANVGV